MKEVLNVKNLSVSYPDFTLHPLSFQMYEGEILSIIGESGSGKTTLAKAVTALFEDNTQVSGEVWIDGQEMLSMTESMRKPLRMNVFSIAFQNSAAWLNPSMKLRDQLAEVLIKKYPRNNQKERMHELMERVGLSPSDLDRYPKELSGGMAQKFLIATAIALDPKFVVLDEPTSSMDIVSRIEFENLIKNLNESLGIAFLIITHDMKLATDLSNRLIVLYEGHVEESGKTAEIMDNPRHPYTRGLVNASIGINLVKDIWGIRIGESEKTGEHGCPFYGRCTQSISICGHQSPNLEAIGEDHFIACHRKGIVTVMKGIGISKSYGEQNVLKDVNVDIKSGEVVSVIGKSGEGKTTLAMILGGFLKDYESGEVLFGDAPADFEVLHRTKHGVQMVFQDSEASLNPHMTVKDTVSEPLRLSGENACTACIHALCDVGLPTDEIFLNKKIVTLSGGQKQRVSIARALTMEPALLIADEPTAMLDPSSKANLIRMLKGLQNQRGFSMLMITHDLECAAKISDRIFLLKDTFLERYTGLMQIPEDRYQLESFS